VLRRSPSLVAAAAACVVAAVGASARAAEPPPPPVDHPDPATLLPPRPPEPPRRASYDLPWERHVEIGPDVAFVDHTSHADALGADSGVKYASTFGFGVHASWAMWRYLQLSLFFFNSSHALDMKSGALGVAGTITSDSVATYSLGARVQPMIPLGPRVRVWASLGVGWQRFDFPRMEVNEPGASCPVNTYTPGSCYMVYERANSMAEFPFGVGASFEVVPRWVAIQAELTALVPAWQAGTAVDPLPVVDDRGHNRVLGGLPVVDLTLVGTLGLSIIL
jgi:hypothetical protein